MLMIKESQTTEFDYFIDAVAELILAYHVESSKSEQEPNVNKLVVSNGKS